MTPMAAFHLDMWSFRENWAGFPNWLKRLTLFVGFPAWLGFALMIVSGTIFEHETLTLIFFGAFFVVVALQGCYVFSTNVFGEFKWFFGIIAAGVALTPIAFLILHEPTPAPQNAVVFGCYTTADAPPIILDKEGMKIVQEGFPRIGFHIERHKQGIALTAEEPIKAEPKGTRYQYAISDRGIGWFLDFYKVVNGSVYGVFDESELAGFRMLATDGRYLPYDKSEASACVMG